MNIIPCKGLEDIQFGTSKIDIRKLLGSPDKIDNLNANDGVSSEIYHYQSLGLALYFDEDSNFLLWGIGITAKSASLLGVHPIGLTEKGLLEAFPSLELDVCYGEFKEFSLREKNIEFFLKNDAIERVMVHPNLDEYCERYLAQK